MKSVDVLIIGAGQGAPPIVEAAVDAGCSYAVAESDLVGGSCVNFGCTPTKAAVASTNLLALARQAPEFGLDITGLKPDYPEILRQAAKFATQSRQGLEEWYDENLFRGHARFAGQASDRYIVRVGDQELHAKYVVIGTGTRSTIPKIEGIGDVDVTLAENWLQRDRLPKTMAIVGGGYIAVEMGQFYRRLGCEVTIIDRGDQPLANEDPDVSHAVRSALEEEGIRFELETSFEHVEPAGTGWRLSCSCPTGPKQLDAQAIFVATGRRANTDDLGLETIGLTADPRTGYITVDERLRTSSPNVFAVGDVRGGGLFTSTAWDDGRIVADLLWGKGRRTTDRIIPYAVFTDPEVGRVGMTEAQAKRQGKDFRVSRFDLTKNGHAQEHRATRGFIKLLIENESEQLLGATVVSVNASDLVMLYCLMMQVKASVSTLRDMVVIHPTFSEALQSAVI